MEQQIKRQKRHQVEARVGEPLQGKKLNKKNQTLFMLSFSFFFSLF